MDQIAQRAGCGRRTPLPPPPGEGGSTRRIDRAALRATGPAATEAVDRASRGEPWEAFREFAEGAAAMRASTTARCRRPWRRARSEGRRRRELGPDVLERLLRLAKRAGELRKDLVVEDIPAMVCSVSSVAVAAAEKPGWRWDRVLAIWLDGVRAGQHPPAAAAGPLGAPRRSSRPAAAQLVGGQLDLPVPPLRRAVVAGDQPGAVHAAQVAVDEGVARLGLVRSAPRSAPGAHSAYSSHECDSRKAFSRPRAAARRPSRCRARTGGPRSAFAHAPRPARSRRRKPSCTDCLAAGRGVPCGPPPHPRARTPP